MDKEIIKITDVDGVEKEVEVINYFTLNSNGKDYITYTENKEDAKGNIIVYTSEVIDKGEYIELGAIEDENVVKEIRYGKNNNKRKRKNIILK